MHERNSDWLLFAPTGDQTRHLGMCPDRKSNQQPFAFLDDTQLTHTGQGKFFLILKVQPHIGVSLPLSPFPSV